MKKLVIFLAFSFGFSAYASCFDPSIDVKRSDFNQGELVSAFRPVMIRKVIFNLETLGVIKSVNDNSWSVIDPNYPTNVMTKNSEGVYVPYDDAVELEATKISARIDCYKLGDRFVAVGETHTISVQRGKRHFNSTGKIAALFENGFALFIFDFKNSDPVDVSEDFQTKGLEIFPYLSVQMVSVNSLNKYNAPKQPEMLLQPKPRMPVSQMPTGPRYQAPQIPKTAVRPMPSMPKGPAYQSSQMPTGPRYQAPQIPKTAVRPMPSMPKGPQQMPRKSAHPAPKMPKPVPPRVR